MGGMSAINLGNLTYLDKNKLLRSTREKNRPTNQPQTEVTNQIGPNMSVLTASERALTALQGHELFNDF